MLAALSPRSFRNLADAPFQPGPGRHLLLGGNGAGKTSLLEAVYLLATTRSFRTADLAACVRHGADGFHLAGLAGDGGDVRLELGWMPGRRLRTADGVERPLAEHLAVQPIVLWTAAEGELFGGAPELGRRLLDRGLVNTAPRGLAVMARYRKLLRHKRELLASGRRGDLDTWNDLFAEAAAELVRLRAGYAAALAGALAAVRERARLELPAVGLEYVPSPRRALDGSEALRAALERAAPRERERGVPLVGPHRDGLRLLWAGREAKTVASAGEGKALGMLLAAAQGEVVQGRGREPLYLLDDADAELDRGRLAAVWELFAPAGQLLATSSRPEVWEGLAGARWAVAAGRIEPG